ncbi:hypothetical protein BGZ61DRAFT_83773 [Ilyonectria robusta]|uniref:uncharacterized protein n=1 Tax=Ilyonectria robusta TaxID=1079257 RepID=UPI001E8E345C|nr:uncharacterized protein BGZ61DRAFT_83773 [Ilyonectria robusta]KAH8735705.1 hypothetical protein BGZ61DRAFT_83773 [Ilyonectria robusta]
MERSVDVRTCRPNCHHPKLVDQVFIPAVRGYSIPDLFQVVTLPRSGPHCCVSDCQFPGYSNRSRPVMGSWGCLAHLMSLNSLKRPPSPRINVASYIVASGGCHQAPQPRIKAEKAGNTADSGQYRRLAIGHSGNANSRNE